jgi:hypothetical protein
MNILCFLHLEKGIKMFFYTVSIRRKPHKWFFIQSPSGESYKNKFLCSLHPEKVTFIHFSYFLHPEKATFMHFSYFLHPLTVTFIHFSYFLQPLTATKIHFSYRRHSAKAIKTNLASPNCAAKGTKMLFCFYCHKKKE